MLFFLAHARPILQSNSSRVKVFRREVDRPNRCVRLHGFFLQLVAFLFFLVALTSSIVQLQWLISGSRTCVQWLEHWSDVLEPTCCATTRQLVPISLTACVNFASSFLDHRPLAVLSARLFHQRRRQSLLERPGILFASSRHSRGLDSLSAGQC